MIVHFRLAMRRVDDLGRIVYPKEIRRTLRIRKVSPLHTSSTRWEKYCFLCWIWPKDGSGSRT